jgi:hypothetical protein
MAGVGCDSSSALLAVAGAIAVLMVVEIFGCCFVAAAVVYHDLNGWLLRVFCSTRLPTYQLLLLSTAA